jgi:hypothetical protein
MAGQTNLHLTPAKWIPTLIASPNAVREIILIPHVKG